MEFNSARKARILAKSFFPLPPEADLSDFRRYGYPDEASCPVISEQEIAKVTRATVQINAAGPDAIPILVLAEAIPVIGRHLTLVFNTSLDLGHCPEHFKESLTVALKKPDRGDYGQPESLGPIALLNTLDKVLEAVIAARLSHIAENLHVLPNNHFGGRKGRGTEAAMHSLLEKIHSAWVNKKVASLLLLDVSSAFDNVCHQRLLHNLRKRRVPGVIVRWIESFVGERRTKIVLPQHRSDIITVNTGTPQGSPLSPILYLYYNADLIETTTDLDNGVSSSG
ncbi:pol-like protein [Cladophialophora carrionii]|uniref:Pol-like protein n=1 Tax=Cladophialophora carrionii TaxID=86049 RepID=A0A1C1CJG4_9EURO|nr:pol-like protein [Cladophialophora carrionii]